MLIDFWFLVEKSILKFYWTKSFQFIEDNFNVEFSLCEKRIYIDHFINVGLKKKNFDGFTNLKDFFLPKLRKSE